MNYFNKTRIENAYPPTFAATLPGQDKIIRTLVNYFHTSTHEFTTCNATCTVGSLMRQSSDSSTYGSREQRERVHVRYNTVLHVQLKMYALFSIISYDFD